MAIPGHHKEIFKHLLGRFDGEATVHDYRDNAGKHPVAIGAFGPSKSRFYSTIGICDRKLKIPSGRFELAAIGASEWLPNALASSLYWLRERRIENWPMVCEDTVKTNAKSTYRHMAYVPSAYEFVVSKGKPVRWLLGIPLKDAEIGIEIAEVWESVRAKYPTWIVKGVESA